MTRNTLRLLSLLFILPFALSAQSLIDAVKKSDMEQVLKLIKEGADPNLKDESGATPLTTACMWGDSDMVSLLLENNATVDQPRAWLGRTPLMVACGYYSGPNVCKLLISKGADVNAVSESGKTPLMLAAKSGKKDVVEYLLSVGADPTRKDIGGFRALDFANHADLSIVQTLKARDYHVDSDGVVAKLKEVTNQ